MADFLPELSISTVPDCLHGDQPSDESEETMKYMLLIHQGSTPTPLDPRGVGDAVRGRAAGGLRRLRRHQRDARGHPGQPASQPPETATTVRVEDGKTLTTDGPFVETKEAIGGCFVFEADDLDAAIEMAAQVPAARLGRRHRGAAGRGVW